MKITLIQTSLAWEDAAANRNTFSEKINSLKEPTDIIILPEMFATGFTMNPEDAAEAMDGESVQWMKQIAAQKNSAITGSLAIKENGNYYNRMFFITSNGEVTTYDKRHLFTLAGEHKKYTPGTKKVLVDYKGWKICLQVCYDLRFPVFSRNTQDYDIVLYPANWPKPRATAWNALLKARAIENMSYTVGLNRTGHDSNGHEYSGHSQVVDCLGEYLLEPQESDGVFTVTLDKESQDETREKFGFLNDRDAFTLQEG